MSPWRENRPTADITPHCDGPEQTGEADTCPYTCPFRPLTHSHTHTQLLTPHPQHVNKTYMSDHGPPVQIHRQCWQICKEMVLTFIHFLTLLMNVFSVLYFPWSGQVYTDNVGYHQEINQPLFIFNLIFLPIFEAPLAAPTLRTTQFENRVSSFD